MVYTSFSTGRADYVLDLNNHPNPKRGNIFEGIDAIIFETGFIEMDEFIFNRIRSENERILPNASYGLQHFRDNEGVLIAECGDKGTPIFSVENPLVLSSLIKEPLEKITSPYSFVLLQKVAPLVPYALTIGRYYGLRESRCNEFVRKMTSFVTYIVSRPLTEERNAIAAEKIEGFIAPYIAEIIGRKPKIGITYGFMHAGIQEDLMIAKRREKTLRKINWRLHLREKTEVSEEFNTVYEARLSEGKWQFLEHNYELF